MISTGWGNSQIHLYLYVLLIFFVRNNCSDYVVWGFTKFSVEVLLFFYLSINFTLLVCM